MSAQESAQGGALAGLRIVEFAGLGPAPFCGMMLADHGAEVIRIDRTSGGVEETDPLLRNRRSIALDLKQAAAREIALRLIDRADGVIEGFRPGVLERLGFAPETLLARNPRLVIGRMTGWGQTGPLAQAAGHDINYIALSGTLHQCGRAGGQPSPPVNFLGDFGGGGMMLAFGMVAGLLAVKSGAAGQVVDCAMTDGAALLAAMSWGFRATGALEDRPGVNLLDTGAPFYDTYETADGKYVAIGSLEPQFYALLLEKCGLAEDPSFADQHDRAEWPALKAKLARVLRQKTREEWDALMEGTDVCYAPVLNMAEAPEHPHNHARGTFIALDGVVQPAPAPRFSATPPPGAVGFGALGGGTASLLQELGHTEQEIEALRECGAVA